MKWTLTELKDLARDRFYIEELVDMKSQLMDRDPSIADVSPVRVTGYIFYDNHSVLATVTCDLTLVLPSTRSLELVSCPMTVEFTERYVASHYLSTFDQDSLEVVIEIEDNIIDLQTAVEDNILLNIPTTVLTQEEVEEDKMPSGNDWEVISQSTYESRKQEISAKGDPRFESLKALILDEQDAEDDNSNQEV